MSEYSEDPFEAEETSITSPVMKSLESLQIKILRAFTQGMHLNQEIIQRDVYLQFTYGTDWSFQTPSQPYTGDNMEWVFSSSSLVPDLCIPVSSIGLNEFKVKLQYMNTPKVPQVLYEGSTYFMELQPPLTSHQRSIDIIMVYQDSELSMHVGIELTVFELNADDALHTSSIESPSLELSSVEGKNIDAYSALSNSSSVQFMSIEETSIQDITRLSPTHQGSSITSRRSIKAERRKSQYEIDKLQLGHRISSHLQVIKKAKEERDLKYRSLSPTPLISTEKRPGPLSTRMESMSNHQLRSLDIRRTPQNRKRCNDKGEKSEFHSTSIDQGSTSSQSSKKKTRPKLIIQRSSSPSNFRSPSILTRLESRRFNQISDFQRRASGHHMSIDSLVKSVNSNLSIRTLRGGQSDLSSTDLVIEKEKFKWESLVRWNFAIPFDSRNCVVEIAIANDIYNENFYYSVSSATPPYRKFSSGTIPIDLAFDLTHRVTTTTTEEDLYAMRSLFHNLFQQADKDHSGSLSFLEIQTIVEKINVGLSPQEISLIIAAADVDASGEVDYNEFVPLAVDMVHTMRTKAKAKQRVNDISESVTDLVLKSLDTKELDRISRLCMDYILAVGMVNDLV